MGEVLHYTAEAEVLFTRIAARHGLTFTPDPAAPVEVLWTFPVQPGLSLQMTLALQNNDELNFGVDELWTYFFPFPTAQHEFERIVDAWVEGRARIVRGRVNRLYRQQVVEVCEDGAWTHAYTHGSFMWVPDPKAERAKGPIQNHRQGDAR